MSVGTTRINKEKNSIKGNNKERKDEVNKSKKQQELRIIKKII